MPAPLTSPSLPFSPARFPHDHAATRRHGRTFVERFAAPDMTVTFVPCNMQHAHCYVLSWRFALRAQRFVRRTIISVPSTAAPPTVFCNPSSSARRGCCWPTTRSRSLAFPVTVYGASYRGAVPSSSPFAVAFTITMPVALSYPRMLSMLLGSISPNVFPHGAHSCTPVAHTLAYRLPPLRALLFLFWRGCLAAGQASYTRHLGSLRRILPCPSPPLRTEQGILEDHRRDDSFAKPRFSC